MDQTKSPELEGTSSAATPSASPAAPPGDGRWPDAWRVEVVRRARWDDPEAEHTLVALGELGLAGVTGVRLGAGYMLSPHFDEATVRRIAAEILTDPVVQEARIGAPGQPLEPRPTARHRILVQRRPGVMDPEAATVAELLSQTGLGVTAEGTSAATESAPRASDTHVETYRAWELEGELDPDQLRLAAAKVLANETIEVVRIDSEDLPFGAPFPTATRGRVEVELLGASDAELQRLSQEGQLSLTLTEMRAVQEHFEQMGRQPSACELETIAQTWSEHCKHKTLCGVIEFEGPDGTVERIDNLLKSTIAKATNSLDRPWCLSVFVDNAGIIEFDQGQALAIKVETHNHPSAIDPYGGAGTGIGGVIRDLLGAGLGALPIANTDCFFVGPTDLPADAVPKGSMHPRRILRGVVAGVRDYGNRMGIPTVSGGVWFDPGYVANPLVYAGTVGLLPASMAHKDVQPGDVIVAVGGRTGRDGIHGATFSSVELSEESEEISGASVQIGDPITEKRVMDCLLQARDRQLYRGITDCGAGGFSSAVGEMAEHTGCEVELERVPLKYPGLSSHEIWISEAQERMVMAVPPDKVDEFLAVFAAEDVEATVIGEFTDTKRLVVKDGGEVVADLDMSFLHDGTPRPTRKATWEAPDLPDPGCPACADPEATLLALLAAPNIASKEWIVRQYDHEVQGTSVLKPLVGVHADGPGDAAVLQPLATSPRGAAISCGANPKYGLLDPYAMAAAAIDEALRNITAVGADPDRAAILDNFSWGNCDKPDRMGSLVLASKACHDAAMAYRTPFISGKDSLNNEYRVGETTLSIPPTLLITALAIQPDVAQTVSMDLKHSGNRLYMVGATDQELGGSHYLAELGIAGGRVPRPDLEQAPALLRLLHEAMRNDLVASCHDLSEGGLAVAAAEMAFAGGLGAHLELDAVPLAPGAEEGADRDAVCLFSESCTRFLVEVPEHSAENFEAVMADVPCHVIGRVESEATLTIRGVDGATLIKLPLQELRQAHQGAFQG